MNTNMRGFNGLQKSLCSCALDESSLSNGKAKHINVCSGKKQPYDFGDIFHAKASLKENI